MTVERNSEIGGVESSVLAGDEFEARPEHEEAAMSEINLHTQKFIATKNANRRNCASWQTAPMYILPTGPLVKYVVKYDATYFE